jgi:indole-3-glycerol phosphate synthase
MATKELIPQPDVILAAKRQSLDERKSRTPIEAVRALASMQKRPQPVLNTIAENAPVMLIGQIKYTAPHNGLLYEPYDPVATALRYVQAGVDAIALFTDETVYHGGLDDLVMVARAVNVPIISQDYILDEYQIVEARAAGASALMLYASALEKTLLRTLVSATQRNRMTAIVEVRSYEELDYALSLSPYVIGISSRDLFTPGFHSDQLHQLRPRIPANIRVMLTDGLTTLPEIEAAIKMGVDAVLVEGGLLDDPDVRADLQSMLHR